jgi:hypothetical protein
MAVCVFMQSSYGPMPVERTGASPDVHDGALGQPVEAG